MSVHTQNSSIDKISAPRCSPCPKAGQNKNVFCCCFFFFCLICYRVLCLSQTDLQLIILLPQPPGCCRVWATMVAQCYLEHHHDGLSEQKGACSGSNMNTPVSRPLYLGGDTLRSLTVVLTPVQSCWISWGHSRCLYLMVSPAEQRYCAG